MKASDHPDAQLSAASVRERQRIAHDLHDGLGQLLGGIALKAQVLAETLSDAQRAEAPAAAELVRLLETAIGQMRVLARGLDPEIAPPHPLGQSLARLAVDTERLFPGVRCVFTGDTAHTLPLPADAMSLFRVAQEAINNALRHGKATHIALTLRTGAGGLALEVCDNGRGLEREAQSGSGIGLRIMKHRVQSMGGTFCLEPGPEGGISVRCHIPLETPPA